MKSFIAILAPIIVMGFWTSRQAWVNAYGDLVELPVRSYDPRELLSSNFLRFHVDYGKYPICKKRTNDRKWKLCVCLKVVGPERRSIVSWSGSCTDRPPWECGLWLRGYCFYDQFIANIERFYVPERYSKSLTVIPPGASIYARLDGQGTGVVTDFRIRGQSLYQFASRNQTPFMDVKRTPTRQKVEEEASEELERNQQTPPKGTANTNTGPRPRNK